MTNGARAAEVMDDGARAAEVMDDDPRGARWWRSWGVLKKTRANGSIDTLLLYWCKLVTRSKNILSYLALPFVILPYMTFSGLIRRYLTLSNVFCLIYVLNNLTWPILTFSCQGCMMELKLGPGLPKYSMELKFLPGLSKKPRNMA